MNVDTIGGTLLIILTPEFGHPKLKMEKQKMNHDNTVELPAIGALDSLPKNSLREK